MSMKSIKIAIRPKLHNYNEDLSKRWFVFYSYRNPYTGKLNRFKVYSGFDHLKTKGERYAHAQKLIDEYNQKLNNEWSPFKNEEIIYADPVSYQRALNPQINPVVETNQFSIIYYIDKIIEKRLPALRKKSQQSYASKIRTFKIWLNKNKLNNKNITHFTDKEALSFINHIQEIRSSTTRNTYLSTFKSFFNDMVNEKFINQNPFNGIKKIKEYRQGKLPFKKHQIELLKNYLMENEPQLWLVCQFQYYCFIRPGELRSLKIGDIDFDNLKILIKGEISKNKKTQNVTIPKIFHKILIDNKIHLYNENSFIFSNGGKPGIEQLSRDYFNKLHAKALKQVGISNKYSLYSWKHTGIIEAIRNGIGLKFIQLQSRHHDLNTLNIYAEQLGAYDNVIIRDNFPAL